MTIIEPITVLLPHQLSKGNISEFRMLFDKFSGDLKDPGSLIADIEVVGQCLAADGAKMLLGEAQWLKEKDNICSILLKAYQLASSTMSIASES